MVRHKFLINNILKGNRKGRERRNRERIQGERKEIKEAKKNNLTGLTNEFHTN